MTIGDTGDCLCSMDVTVCDEIGYASLPDWHSDSPLILADFLISVSIKNLDKTFLICFIFYKDPSDGEFCKACTVMGETIYAFK